MERKLTKEGPLARGAGVVIVAPARNVAAVSAIASEVIGVVRAGLSDFGYCNGARGARFWLDCCEVSLHLHGLYQKPSHQRGSQKQPDHTRERGNQGRTRRKRIPRTAEHALKSASANPPPQLTMTINPSKTSGCAPRNNPGATRMNNPRKDPVS